MDVAGDALLCSTWLLHSRCGYCFTQLILNWPDHLSMAPCTVALPTEETFPVEAFKQFQNHYDSGTEMMLLGTVDGHLPSEKVKHRGLE